MPDAAPPASADAPQRLTSGQWLIVIIAALGFAFDIYELLMLPLTAPDAIAELRQVDPTTAAGHEEIRTWFGYILYSSAVCGGIFGLIGGYLTDRFGRRRVLVWSILLYAFSALASGFSTNIWMLLILRCTTFIGVCVEFVAAIAWLAELFPHPRQRELVLGYTQAFQSVGGLMVTGAYLFCAYFAEDLPKLGADNAWRWTMISGVIPAIPLILIRPFLPESPAWQAKRAAGTLKRPSFAELFRPQFRRTTLVTAAMVACVYGAAFGAIQLMPQIVPGLLPEHGKELRRLQPQRDQAAREEPGSAREQALKARIAEVRREVRGTVGNVQLFQEIGGLVGRFALAAVVVYIVSRRKLLRVFQVPGLILIPWVFLFPAAGNAGDYNFSLLKGGIFAAGVLTVAQMSFWGNYLPRAYPVYLRGTGESFAANVGGRMFGTSAGLLTTQIAGFFPGANPSQQTAYAAAAVVTFVYLVGFFLSFFLPEPKQEALPD